MASETYNVPPLDDRVTIVCLYCEKAQEVSRKALSVTCKFCSKALKLEDIRFKEYQARRAIDTCGVVTVEKAGFVNHNDAELIMLEKLNGREPPFVAMGLTGRY